MFASSYLFVEKNNNYQMLERSVVNATSAINIASIAKVSKDEAVLTLATGPSAWPTKVVVASATAAVNNGTFDVITYDFTAKTIKIKNPLATTQAGVAGTATPGGIALRDDFTKDYTEIFNNAGDLVAKQYNEDGYFMAQKMNVNQDVVFQITNMDAASGHDITQCTLEFSLDGVEWHPFNPTLVSGVIGDGESCCLVVQAKMICLLRLYVNVDANLPDYCVHIG